MLHYTCTLHVRSDNLPRNKHPEETVQKILDASLQLFVEKGYEETTVLDIINNMGGMTRGAFYHHFKSKEEVFDALSDKLFDDNNIFKAAKNQTHLNGLEKLKYLINIGSFEENDRTKLSFSIMPLLDSPAFLKKLIIDTNRNFIAPAYQEIIEEGILDGSIKTDNPKLLSELLTFITNFWMIPSIYPVNETETWEKIYFIKDLLEKIGLPILDDELIDRAKTILSDDK